MSSKIRIVQWSILKKLFLNTSAPFCLVGDPKQSIYAFRNADVYTYLEAKEALGKGSRRQLSTNYRSSSTVVSALNRLFSHASQGWIPLPKLGKQLEVEPVDAAHATGDPGSVCFFMYEAEKGRSKKWPSEAVEEEKLFPFIASYATAIHKEKGVAWHEIAILIKDRNQAARVVKYLHELGIPASFKRGIPLAETPAFFLMKELIAAALSPYDLSCVKAAMGGPLFGWTEQDLKGGIEHPQVQLAKQKMSKLGQILREKGVGPFFEAAVERTSSFYAETRKICELLIEEETKRGCKAEALLDFLKGIEKETAEEDPHLKTRPQEEKGSLSVMTVHMSKGLEFHTVFALGLASRHPPSSPIVLKKEGGEALASFDPEDPDCLAAVQEIDAEKLRQLYVALTRAKERLFIPLVIDLKTLEFAPGEASPIELFFSHLLSGVPNRDSINRLLDTMAPDITYRWEEAPLPPKQTDLLPPPTSPPISSPSPLHFKEERVVSFSSLATKGSVSEEIFSEPPSDILPVGTETGLILHRVFEEIFKHFEKKEKIPQLIAQQIRGTSLEGHEEYLCSWIDEILRQPLLNSGSFCLFDISPHHIVQEMEFLFPVEEGMMKGFIDLFFAHEGKYYLLDWKTNYLGPNLQSYTQEKLLEAMRAHDYFLQASIYTSALSRYVKLFDNRPFNECFGGAIYYFVRGKAPLLIPPGEVL